jgi:RNA 2',3'-cyclic 3'-phosphodiesterase
MRLFVGIDIPDDLRAQITAFVEECRTIAPDVRWMKPEALHVTLKFIGETKQLDEIKTALANVQSPTFQIVFRDIGFFTQREPRVFWIGVHASDALPALARNVDEAAARIGIKREERGYAPHLTLARAGSGNPKQRGRGNSGLSILRDRLGKESQRDFGTMLAKEFFLYQSQLSPKGARYTKLERFELQS